MQIRYITLHSLACALTISGNLIGMAAISAFAATHPTATLALAATAGGAAVRLLTPPDRSAPTIEQLKITMLTRITNPSVSELTHALTKKADIEDALKNRSGIIAIDVVDAPKAPMYYRIHEGLAEALETPTKSPITVYSPGCTDDLDSEKVGLPIRLAIRGGILKTDRSAFCAYTAIKSGLIKGDCVTFYPSTNTWRRFNYGQRDDIRDVGIVFDHVAKQYHDRSFVLYGASKGAVPAIQVANDPLRASNIKAVIAESPTRNLFQATNGTLSWWPNRSWFPSLGAVVDTLARCVFPNYESSRPSSSNPSVLNTPQMVSTPLLIPTLAHDQVATLADVQLLRQRLKGLSPEGRIIEVPVIENAKLKHGRGGGDPRWRESVQQFMDKYVYAA